MNESEVECWSLFSFPYGRGTTLKWAREVLLSSRALCPLRWKTDLQVGILPTLLTLLSDLEFSRPSTLPCARSLFHPDSTLSGAIYEDQKLRLSWEGKESIRSALKRHLLPIFFIQLPRLVKRKRYLYMIFLFFSFSSEKVSSLALSGKTSDIRRTLCPVNERKSDFPPLIGKGRVDSSPEASTS